MEKITRIADVQVDRQLNETQLDLNDSINVGDLVLHMHIRL